MSRSSQPAHAVGVFQRAGSDARSNMPSTSRRSTRRSRPLLAGFRKSHVGSTAIIPVLVPTIPGHLGEGVVSTIRFQHRSPPHSRPTSKHDAPGGLPTACLRLFAVSCTRSRPRPSAVREQGMKATDVDPRRRLTLPTRSVLNRDTTVDQPPDLSDSRSHDRESIDGRDLRGPRFSPSGSWPPVTDRIVSLKASKDGVLASGRKR